MAESEGYSLRMSVPVDEWLDPKNDYQEKVDQILEDRDVKVFDAYGGTGLGNWSDGTHDNGWDVETDEGTANDLAKEITESVGYEVEVSKYDSDE